MGRGESSVGDEGVLEEVYGKKGKKEVGEVEEIVKFLAMNRAYPVCSKNGRIYFISRRNNVFGRFKDHIIEKLNLRTEEDCKRIREAIKEEISKSGLRVNRPIKKWVKEERPREMLVKHGAEKLNTTKLLAIILRTGSDGVSAEDLARKLMNHFGSLRAMDSASITELCEIEGIGIAKAAQVKAALEIGKRLMRENAEKIKRIKDVNDVVGYVFDYYSPYLRDAKKEFFNVILLDSSNKPIKNLELSKGGLDASIVDVREIVREASREGAASIILVHNHPSGEAEPSGEDIRITKRIVEACNLIGVRVLDHVIIGKNREDYVSFLEKGLLA
jgi:DNA repair protein RadC